MLSSDTVKICPNATQVEFTCMAENVTELVWKSITEDDREIQIYSFHIRWQAPFDTPDGYIVYLDNETVTADLLFRFTTIVSRLRVETISDLIGGRIECRMYESMTYVSESLNINLIGKSLEFIA